MSQKELAGKPTNGKAPAKPRRTLPTDRIAFPKQLEILRSWAAASGPSNKPVLNAEASAIIGMASSTISLANPFFTDIGLLQRGDGGLVPSAEVVSFNHSFQWNPETAPTKLAPIIEASWFSQALVPRLGFGPLSEPDAIAALSEAAGAGREYEDQLRTLLLYMEASGLIALENGTIRRTAGAPRTTVSSTTSTTTSTTPGPSASTEAGRGQLASVSTSFSKPTEGMVNFHVSFRVDMQEMGGWSADRISSFFNGIAQVLNAKGSIEEREAT